MKTAYQRLGYIFMILYLFGIFFLAYFLYKLPEDFTYNTKVITIEELVYIFPSLNKIYIITSIVFLLGLIAAIFGLLANNQKQEENIVYVERQSLVDEMDGAEQKSKSESLSQEELITKINEILKQYPVKKDSWEKILEFVCKRHEAVQGAIYLNRTENKAHFIELFVSYAFVLPESKRVRYELGEGLAGQVAKEGNILNISDIPNGYITVISGLGSSNPTDLLIQPIRAGESIIGVVEIASFSPINEKGMKDIELAFSLLTKEEMVENRS